MRPGYPCVDPATEGTLEEMYGGERLTLRRIDRCMQSVKEPRYSFVAIMVAFAVLTLPLYKTGGEAENIINGFPVWALVQIAGNVACVCLGWLAILGWLSQSANRTATGSI